MEVKNMELKGSKTEQNLMEAFSGESQAAPNTHFMRAKLKKKVTNKSPLYF